MIYNIHQLYESRLQKHHTERTEKLPLPFVIYHNALNVSELLGYGE